MRTWLASVQMMIGLLMMTGARAEDLPKPSPAQLSRLMLLTAEEISKQLPKKVDEVTTLLSVLATPRGLLYNFRADISKDEVEPSAVAQFRRNQIEAHCEEPTSLKFLKLGAEYTKVYVDRTGRYMFTVEVKLSDCR